MESQGSKANEEGGGTPVETNVLYQQKLTPQFREFIEANNIPIEAYNIQALSRFVRVNPQKKVSIEELERQLNAKIDPVAWLPGFYKLKADVQIANTTAYKEGSIYGIDVSSGAVVVALDPQSGDNVLDICCAPGAKLSMIADILQDKGSITGVDISDKRLAACRSMVKKYDLKNVRLFLQDATTFSILAPNEEVQIFINQHIH